ncbi:NFACT family protein [Acidianus sp. HS-5]|uniref:Rqc2 family fibronectin-binding protein n=1 Tax=Acidianus sp. HS-5 TaxID=2886040 RepID=UPI001F3AC9F3|nr:NFACT family protein [Acidianus sp. HS-5]BDC19104.1 RNA-binding protein [Acidianus sp. HS-5]
MAIKLPRKNSMSYIDLLAWVVENKNELIGCRIDNIYNLEKLENVFIFKLHCKSYDRNLIIEPGTRINFTKYDIQKEIGNKAKTLRELIRDLIISNIEIMDKERILKIELSNGMKIILELLPRGLLLVLDNQDKIKFATEYKEFKDRIVKPGLTYTQPPKPKKTVIPKDVINALHLAETANVEEEYDKLEKSIIEGKITPCIQKGINFMPIEFEGCEKGTSFNDVIDEYFLELTKEREIQKTTEKIEGEKKKLEKTIQQIEENIKEYEEKAEELRNIGKYLMEHYMEVENAVKNKQKKIKVGDKEIEINPGFSVTKNSSLYFDKAKEYVEKEKKAKETLEELKRKLNEIEKEIKREEEGRRLSIRKKEWYEKYRWSFTTNGFLVIAGKDSDQNESLVRKLLEDTDIFMHADIQGAATTIIKNPKNITDQDIYDAAVIAASYSRAWKMGLAAVDVFWVYGNQVSKSPPTGEYLPKGSFMIYGKKNYIKAVKLSLAIGFKIDDTLEIIAGSENSISAKVKNYVVISPGEELERTVDRIVKILSELNSISPSKELKSEVLSILPGKSKIVKVVKETNGKQ